MHRTVQDAYVVAALRTPVGRAPRGAFRHTRPDDLLAALLRGLLARVPQVEAGRVEDVIIGCALPEAEQGLNVARIALLLAGLPERVPGVTVNRFCASGLEAVARAADRIRLREAELLIAGGVESMSLVPLGGHHPAVNPRVLEDEHVAIAFGMGLTAERVASRWQVSREDQDRYALASHQKALTAQAAGAFGDEILPYTTVEHHPDLARGVVAVVRREVAADEGPRPDTSLPALAALRPVFAAGGSVTPGNSSQMSDGAAALLLASPRAVRALGLTPLARFLGYAVSGVPPEVMGIGPLEAVPKVLAQTGLSLSQMDWIELNEAFAAQTLAVIRALDLDPARVNPLGGAIALGHPLGATGAIRAATLVHGLRRQRLRYGLVTMCVGTGMGAAGVFEAL